MVITRRRIRGRPEAGHDQTRHKASNLLLFCITTEVLRILDPESRCSLLCTDGRLVHIDSLPSKSMQQRRSGLLAEKLCDVSPCEHWFKVLRSFCFLMHGSCTLVRVSSVYVAGFDMGSFRPKGGEVDKPVQSGAWKTRLCACTDSKSWRGGGLLKSC